MGSNPQIPTNFIANVGNAVPIANTLEILGTAVAAHAVPLQTVGSGNTISINVQYASASASSIAANAGVASFNSTFFSVDANGYVTFNGAAGTESFTVDTFTAPGTNPVLPNGSGNVTVTGGQVAAGTTTNVIRTDSLAANTYTIQVQRSSAQAASTVGANGVSHFSSGMFSVDSNGFVTLAGGGQAIDSIAVQTGTSPIAPTSAGLITINGAVVAAGTNPIRTDGTGANTMAVEVQISQALSAADATKIGLSNFDSTSFAVSATGFVTLIGGGFTWTDVSGAFSPLKENGYFVTATATGTLPASPAQGDTIKFFVDSASQFLTIKASGTQLIRFGSLASSAGGTAISTLQGDSVELIYRANDTQWCAIAGFTGTWLMA